MEHQFSFQLVHFSTFCISGNTVNEIFKRGYEMSTDSSQQQKVDEAGSPDNERTLTEESQSL